MVGEEAIIMNEQMLRQGRVAGSTGPSSGYVITSTSYYSNYQTYLLILIEQCESERSWLKGYKRVSSLSTLFLVNCNWKFSIKYII